MGPGGAGRGLTLVDAILTLVEKTALLKAFPVFAQVPTEALAQLAARAREIHYDAGAAVIREGEPNRGTLLVVEGQLEVRKGGQFARLLGPGMGFGQLELLEGEPHTLSVTALEHAHVISLSIDDMLENIMDFPEVGLALIRLLATRIQELLDRTIALHEEVARLVAALKRAGVPLPGGAGGDGAGNEGT